MRLDKTLITGSAVCLLSLTGVINAATASSPDFATNFSDSTLRMDYIFGGGNRSSSDSSSKSAILLHKMSKFKGWAGRRSNLDRVPYAGNGEIVMRDPLSGDTLYRHTFSSLFQEWLATAEADSASRSFENTFILPLPKRKTEIILRLFDGCHLPIGDALHVYSPDDELVASSQPSGASSVYIHKGSDPAKAIDVAILAEGYTVKEQDKFLERAKTIVNEILSYEPYKSFSDNFNFIAVFSPSADSGVSIPKKGVWKNTPFSSHFSTFHSPRYLTTPHLFRVHDALDTLPYEHVIILVNTDNYGGGGIYNSYLITAADNDMVLPVSVHEFGHSFGGLADEYFYDYEESDYYPLSVEPWEPNITTMVDFSSKWEDMINPENPGVGIFEGGGYRTKGVFRPVSTCRMRDNVHPDFCPVCQRALRRLIQFYIQD